MMKKFNYSEYEQLKIINIFEYYDKPLFYIAESPSKDLFMFYFVESNNTTSVWFTSQISRNEVNEIFNQQIGELEFLNKLYSMGRLFKCNFNANIEDKCNILFSEVNEDNIDLEDFPEENFLAEYDYLNDQELIYVPKIIEDKRTFKIILKDAINSHQVAIDFLISTLSNVKQSLNSLAKDSSGASTSQPVELNVIAFPPSSFGIWFEVNSTDLDLFNLTNTSVNNFFELLEDVNKKDEKDITDEIFVEKRYSIDSIKKMDKLLNNIVDFNYDLIIEGYPKGTLVENTFVPPSASVEFKKSNHDKIKKLKNILSGDSSITHEEIEIEGIFMSVNLRKNGFWLNSKNEDINGLFENKLFEKLKKENNYNIRVPSDVKAILLKTTTRDHIANVYSTKYTLTSFKYLE